LEDLKIKEQLRYYLENKLELEDYHTFFDSLTKIESDILMQWINEILASDFKVYNEERIMGLINFDTIQQKLNTQIISEYKAQATKNTRTKLFRWIGYAAAILCVVGLSMYILKPQNGNSTVYLFENNHPYNISAMLPDSSMVILYPNTKINYTLNSSTDTRDIAHLKGKVLYIVKKSVSPFKVNYEEFTTTALGTKFIVDAQKVRHPYIKLLEGKISVSHAGNANNKQVILEREGVVSIDVIKSTINQHFIPTTNSESIEKIRENKITVIAESKGKVHWSSNLLEVNQIQSLEIFKLLEQIYDVTILSENSDLLNYKFTGSINREQRVEDFLTNYCELNGCSFTNKDQIIVISTNQRKEVFR